jgi:hypothetical protein
VRVKGRPVEALLKGLYSQIPVSSTDCSKFSRGVGQPEILLTNLFFKPFKATITDGIVRAEKLFSDVR